MIIENRSILRTLDNYGKIVTFLTQGLSGSLNDGSIFHLLGRKLWFGLTETSGINSGLMSLSHK